jgi:hypothetical protein
MITKRDGSGVLHALLLQPLSYNIHANGTASQFPSVVQ